MTAILPGHGPVVTDPEGVADLLPRAPAAAAGPGPRRAPAGGDTTPAEVVARVYADVDRSVWPAAEQSVRAQLDYLGDLTSGPRTSSAGSGLSDFAGCSTAKSVWARELSVSRGSLRQ